LGQYQVNIGVLEIDCTVSVFRNGDAPAVGGLRQAFVD